MKTLIIGSRRSQLAQVQSNLVRQQLMTAWDNLEVKIELFDTQGDLNRRDPLPQIGGKGLFTAELEEALRQRRIDLAVHSLKDLPVDDSPALTVVAIPARAPTQDVLLCRKANSLETLPHGSFVGTSSLRRAAQILALRPDLKIKDIRGNIDTRLRKLDDPDQGYDAILLAQAGLTRLGHANLDHVHPLAHQVMLPAPGQGALGVQGRANDPQTTRYLQVLNHTLTRASVTAERAFLAGLGGGCSLPVGALATAVDNQLDLEGLVARPDGTQLLRLNHQGHTDEAESIGYQLAQKALAQGAAELLAS